MVVHVGSMPLRAPPGPTQWALLSADRLLSIQHFYTILQPISYFPSGQNPVKRVISCLAQSNVCTKMIWQQRNCCLVCV